MTEEEQTEFLKYAHVKLAHGRLLTAEFTTYNGCTMIEFVKTPSPPLSESETIIRPEKEHSPEPLEEQKRPRQEPEQDEI